MKTFVIGDVHGRCAQLLLLLEMIARDAAAADSVVLLGDLIDRGADVPGVVRAICELQRERPTHVVCLRGNHEQMLLDFVDERKTLWLAHGTGSNSTIQQYAAASGNIGEVAPLLSAEENLDELRCAIINIIPPDQLEFLRSLPLYHEDEYALYVHAGLDGDKHPRDTEPHYLLWSRDANFFKHYTGKPCVFGHTPTPLLPLLGRVGRHGIYISHSAIGLDTGYAHGAPLSCLQLPDFTLYQAFADNHTAVHHITAFIPETLRAMRS
ncbi:MAG: metallophosphoesterase [Pyrinomonadaceae bacterium]